MSAKPVLVPSGSANSESVPAAIRSQLVTTSCMVAADFVTLMFVFGLTVLARRVVTPSYHLGSYFETLLPCLMMMGGFSLHGLYPGVLIHPSDEMRRIFVSITGVFLVIASATFLWRSAESYSRSVFLVSWAIGSPVVFLTRHFVRQQLSRASWWGVPALLLGSGASAQRVLYKLKNKRAGMRVLGVLSDSTPIDWPADLPPYLGPTSMAPGLAAARFANYAIVAVSHKSNTEIRHVIEDYCRGFGHVLLMPDMPGLCSLGVSAREVGGEMGLELPQRLFHRGPSIAKRWIDLLFCALILLTLSPLLLLLALLVKASSKGPILYRHTRYGRNGATFGALKFRTMVPEAEHALAAYLAAHPEELFEWKRNHKLKNDPRVTAVGKWLRRFSLDELPQVFNVLAGQMSIVGPRPIVKDEIEKYGRGYALYVRVLPGITGLWQVSGRNNTTYGERVAFDEFYVNNWSVWLDAYIFIRTIKVVLTADGAY